MATRLTDRPLRVGGASGRTLLVGPSESPAGYTSIQDAIDDAAEGDVIYVQPGTYDENLVVTTDYLTIVGAQLGGYGRPDITPATGHALTVTAQGFVCEHVRFAAAAGSGTSAVLQEGNGFRYTDCVFDGDGAGTTGVLLKGNADDDAFTASEGVIEDCLFRGAAVGLAFDTGDAPNNGVGCTHDVIRACRFIDNTQDIVTLDTGGGVYSVQDTLIAGCHFLDKNKANYIDFTTAGGGAASDQTGMIADCFFAADAITAGNQVRLVGTGWALVGCRTTVGVLDGSGLD